MSSNFLDGLEVHELLKIAIAEISELPDRTEVIEFIRRLKCSEPSETEQDE